MSKQNRIEANTESPTSSVMEPDTTRKRITWMTPYWDIWVQRMGKPVGRTAETVAGKFATYLRPLIEEYGDKRVFRAWKRYMAQRTAKLQPAWFAEQFKEWDQCADSRADPDLYPSDKPVKGRRF